MKGRGGGDFRKKFPPTFQGLLINHLKVVGVPGIVLEQTTLTFNYINRDKEISILKMFNLNLEEKKSTVWTKDSREKV